MFGWQYSQKRYKLNVERTASNNCGYVYVVKIKVTQNFSLLKIGATRDYKTRLQNYSSKTATIFCVSKPHLNFWENEEILHEAFKDFRVPARPHQGSRAEFFNMKLTDFFANMPDLIYLEEDNLKK